LEKVGKLRETEPENMPRLGAAEQWGCIQEQETSLIKLEPLEPRNLRALTQIVMFLLARVRGVL
jgi:hypothetical protein